MGGLKMDIIKMVVNKMKRRIQYIKDKKNGGILIKEIYIRKFIKK